MKIKLNSLISTVSIALMFVSLGAAKSFREYQKELLQSRKSDWLQKRLTREFFPDKGVGTSAVNPPFFPQPTFDPLPDFKVNTDAFPATYPQSNPRVAIFPNKSYLAVWEETRNGFSEIYGQMYDSLGIAIGPNAKLNSDVTPAPVDKYLPDVGVAENGNFVVVWVDYDSLSIYFSLFDQSVTPITPLVKVNTGPANTAWRPAVAVAPSGAFVVVWEDIRSGFNVYRQFYDAAGTPVGINSKINSDLGFFMHLAPRAKYDGSGNLVVVWEDYRNGDADIYFQRFNSSGAPIDTNMLVTSDVGTEDQYLPDVDQAFDGRLVVTYVDTKSGDPDIYFQRYSAAALPQGLATKANSDAGANEQWDPAIGADSLDNFVIAWADYRSTPAIYTQRYDSLGAAVGSNAQRNTVGSTQERNSPGIDRHRGGNYFLAWQDHRNGNFDIYGQRVTASDLPQGANLKVNDDNTGAYQKNPAIVTTPNGNFYVAWEDYRTGNADIAVRAFDRFGNPLTGEGKVNSDVSLTDQIFPDICADKNGNLMITWLDLAFGTRIMGQFYNSALSPIDLNFEISDDTGSAIHNRPACGAMADDKFVIVWSDNRNVFTTQNIYGQIIDLPLFPIGPFPPNFKINDDTSSFDHLNPRVGADTMSSFVVVWQDSRNGLSRIFGRAYDVNGTPQGPSEAIQSDSANTVQYQPDISLSPQAGVIVWLEDRAAGTNIFAQRYSSGIPLGANLAIADPSLGLPRNPRVAMDRNEAFFVTWEDNRNGNWDIFGQFYYSSNDSAGPDFKVNSDIGSNLQLTPDVALSRNEVYLAWADSRNPGLGLDIYAKLVSYQGVDVGQPKPEITQLPRDFQLSQNYPNPFNLVTHINYALPQASEVRIDIYDLLGRRVKSLDLGRQSAGYKTVAWDGRNERGEVVASGVYFYRLKAGDFVQSKKMTLLK